MSVMRVYRVTLVAANGTTVEIPDIPDPALVHYARAEVRERARNRRLPEPWSIAVESHHQ